MQQSVEAQLHARGMCSTNIPCKEDELKKRRRYKHVPWQPSFYGQAEALSADDWSSFEGGSRYGDRHDDVLEAHLSA